MIALFEKLIICATDAQQMIIFETIYFLENETCDLQNVITKQTNIEVMRLMPDGC
jgi:hypothetical protein